MVLLLRAVIPAVTAAIMVTQTVTAIVPVRQVPVPAALLPARRRILPLPAEILVRVRNIGVVIKVTLNKDIRGKSHI